MTGFDDFDDELLAAGLLPDASDDLDDDDLNDVLDEVLSLISNGLQRTSLKNL